jgi:glycosyltransferase involved in cell wall biosynthesis
MVSIIIPHYNCSEIFRFVYNELLNEEVSKTQIELIVIDDFSTDYEYEKLKAILNKGSIKFNLIRNSKNHGPGYCRNIGLKFSSFEYILFLDCDDFIDLEVLYIMLQIIMDEKLDICINRTSFKWILKEDKLEKLNDILFDEFCMDNFLRFVSRKSDSNFVPTACILIKKKFLIKYNLIFPVGYSKTEDTVFKFRILINNPKYRNIVTDRSFFAWNQNAGSITRNLSKDQKLSNMYHTLFASLDLLKICQTIKQYYCVVIFMLSISLKIIRFYLYRIL